MGAELSRTAYLSKLGVDIIFSENALIKACKEGYLEAVRRILEEKTADVNSKSDGGTSALSVACIHDHTKIVTILLEYGADIDASESGGFTPLMYAARQGNLDVVRVLIEKGANVNIAKDDGYTALTLASTNNHKTIKF